MVKVKEFYLYPPLKFYSKHSVNDCFGQFYSSCHPFSQWFSTRGGCFSLQGRFGALAE